MIKYIKIFLVAIIFFGLGFFFNHFLISNNKFTEKLNKEKSFQAGWEAARKRFKDTGYFSEELFMAETPITSLIGNVKNIKDNEIIIKISIFDPLSDPELDQRNVLINTNTKIYKISKKDEAEYNRETEAFWLEHPEFKDMPDAPIGQPTRYYDKLVTQNDIKLGDNIVVESEDDVRNQKKYIANKIVIQL